MERLAHLKPTIDNKKLSQERKKQLNILKFIGKHSPSHTNQLHTIFPRQSQQVGKTLEHENRYRIKTENFKEDEDSSKFIHSWNMNLNLRPKYSRQSTVVVTEITSSSGSATRRRRRSTSTLRSPATSRSQAAGKTGC